jgi:serine/threonine protein phosphatase 1
LVLVVGAETPPRYRVAHAERISPTGRLSLPDDALDTGVVPKYREWIAGYDDYGDLYDLLLWGCSIRLGADIRNRNAVLVITHTFVGHTVTVPREPGVLERHRHVFLDFVAFSAAENPRCGLLVWDVFQDCGVLQTGRGEFARLTVPPKT